MIPPHGARFKVGIYVIDNWGFTIGPVEKETFRRSRTAK